MNQLGYVFTGLKNVEQMQAAAKEYARKECSRLEPLVRKQLADKTIKLSGTFLFDAVTERRVYYDQIRIDVRQSYVGDPPARVQGYCYVNGGSHFGSYWIQDNPVLFLDVLQHLVKEAPKWVYPQRLMTKLLQRIDAEDWQSLKLLKGEMQLFLTQYTEERVRKLSDQDDEPRMAYSRIGATVGQYQERQWDVHLLLWTEPHLHLEPDVLYNNFVSLGLCICASNSPMGLDIEKGLIRVQPFYHDLESIAAGYEFQGGLFGILREPWKGHQPGTLVMELWIEPPTQAGAKKAFCLEKRATSDVTL